MTREIGIVALLIVCGALFSAAQTTTKKGSPASGAAQTYCTSTGGAVETRVPAYGTNGPPTSWLKLAGREDFCRYTATDGSHIHLSLETLFTPQPSLAALAYYSLTPPIPGQGNPASVYCSQLGGSDLFGGINAAGGGWVGLKTIDEVLEACIFPDNSTIDSWGLFYHSASIIRGIDLSTVLKYANPYLKAKGGKQ